MSSESRRLKILDAARRDGRVSVEALAGTLGVSPHTIRRDINLLCEGAKLRRLHGGAEYIETKENLPYSARAVMNARAKKAIAARAAEIIPDGAPLFISIGTAPAIAAAALADKPGLTVITNNLNAANALAIADAPGTRIVLPGGQLRLPDRDFLGEEAVQMFEAYRADFGLYGVGGIEAGGALLDFEESEVRARERIRRNSRVSLLLADHTKFGRRATVAGGRLADADCMIVDRLPGAPFRALLDGFPGRLILAEDMPRPAAPPGRIPAAGSEAEPAPAGGSATDA